MNSMIAFKHFSLPGATLFLTSLCQAQNQAIPMERDTITSGCAIQIVTYQTLVNDQPSNQGIIFRRTRIPCRIKFSEGEYTLLVGKNTITYQPRLYFTCQDVTVGKTFNNRKDGKRTGIWFRRYPWGKIRKAMMYDDGLVDKIVFFRPNGHIIRYRYRFRKEPHMNVQYFDKDGTVFPNIHNFEPVTYRDMIREANEKRKAARKRAATNQ